MHYDRNQRHVQEPNHRTIYLNHRLDLDFGAIQKVAQQVHPQIYAELRCRYMWPLLHLEHLEEAGPHDEAKLGGRGEQMEQIDAFNCAYLPASRFKVLTDCLGVVVAGVPVYDSVCSIGNEGVDDCACNVDHLHYLLEFIVGRSFEEDLHHEVMDGIAHHQ